ncbi:hypothetical protein Syun_005607 [Stephania yunnanensis]|uniref:Tyrosinase copper-binding domain-containing protein n=1 Tax=Stephania yunnanensis TaxID=152371 RepID=A0AAP0L625_9MAGN
MQSWYVCHHSVSVPAHHPLRRRPKFTPPAGPGAGRRAPSSTTASTTFSISCGGERRDDDEHGRGQIGSDVGRRDLLLRSSGLCVGAAAAATTLGIGISSSSRGATGPAHQLGDPVQPPPLNKCHPITDLDCLTYDCCPPYSSKDISEIRDFVPPGPGAGLRQRRPARELMQDPAYLEKFGNAIDKMKNLPKDDPWNLIQQANIHCAYCDDAYEQTGYPDVRLQVHFGWNFLPWHRFYIYFWERILGKLIGDETFALPYWNWDDEAEMTMPRAFWDPKDSFLYDALRNQRHREALLDYRYTLGDDNPTKDQYADVVAHNRNQLRHIFSEDYLVQPDLFMGMPVRAGDGGVFKRSGALELLHNVIHNWTGEVISPYLDMGNFRTAARDPIFFGHHANIDRLWDIYRNKRGKVEFRDRDWLDASFLFYDENRRLVKCKVRQGLLPKQLGYEYKYEDPTWENVGDARHFLSLRKASVHRERARAANNNLSPPTEFGSEPRALDTTIRALGHISTPFSPTNTTVLIVEDIKFDHQSPIRFDVYVTKPTESHHADLGELAGSFVNVPHGIAHGDLEHILEGTGPSVDDDKLVITLVPRLGQVTVGGIRIESIPITYGADDEGSIDSE